MNSLVLAIDYGRGPGGNELINTARTGTETIPLPSWIPISIILLSIMTALVIKEYKKDKKDFIGLIFIGLFWIGLIVVVVQSRQSIIYTRETNTQWVIDMKELSKNADQEYLKDETYYALSDPLIVSVSTQLMQSSVSAEDYAAKVLNYVDKNVRYDSGESDEACFDGTAPAIIQRGIGQCDTQSIVVVSLLRSAYIPSRIVGGCVSKKPSCGALMGFLSIKKGPRFTPISTVTPGKNYSRGEDTYSREGGLHAYPQAMLPDSQGLLEWHTLEATAGTFADTDCYAYYPEIETATSKQQICVSKNYDYARACASNDYQTLGTFGGPYTQ